jgi:hypothetical protein
MSAERTYDSKCYELAQHFSDAHDPLSDAELHELAKDIQVAVEDFFGHREHLKEKAGE